MALDERTRKLLAAASRQDASVESFALTLEPEDSLVENSHLIKRPCLDCGRPAHGIPGASIRCLDCNRKHFGVNERDPYEPVPSPHGASFYRIGEPTPPIDWRATPKAEVPDGFPRRIRKDDEREPSVAPEWTVHSIGPMPAPPASVTALLKVAEGYGWTGVITYARGQAPKARTVKDNFAVRLHKGDLRAVAVNAGGVWESYWAVAHMLRLPNQDEFKAYLMVAHTDLAESFVRRIRVAAAEAEEKVAPVKCRDGLAHLAHSWKNSKGAVKECPGIACDLLDKHDAHEVAVKISKKEERRPCPGRTRKGTAKRDKDNGG